MNLAHIETAPDDFRGETQASFISNHIKFTIYMSYLQKLVLEERKGPLNQYVIVDMDYAGTVRYYKDAIRKVLPTEGEIKSTLCGQILPRKLRREPDNRRPTCPECYINNALETSRDHDSATYWEKGLKVYECKYCGYICSGKRHIQPSKYGSK